MQKIFRYLLFILTLFCSQFSKAQTISPSKDTVIQLYGIVLSADSLKALSGTSIIVENKGRGTISNNQGVFSIVVEKGDVIRFSSIGFKDVVKEIPTNLKGTDFSVIQLMVNDTAYLPSTIIKARPTRAQFERDFVNTNIPADAYEIARENTSIAKRRILLSILPADGTEAVSSQMRQQAQKYYYQGQQPPINLFNPAAWADFIQAWKRGDFKSKQ
ncbi:MAG: carboxypeptidase-like regulatory domain-containing protein [Bacteroidetes bacterium]|nr:carboxypeptidase-like regulatory domain-containing protein [Bacteroidota bacterium]